MVIRILLMVIGIVGIILFYLPLGKKGIVNAGNVTGLITGVIFLTLGTFSFLFSRGFKIALLVIILLFLILILMVNVRLTKAKNNVASNERVVVVLGCTSKYYISDMLNRRIKEAARYLDKHEDAVCIACGGKGNDFYNTEAEYIAVELSKYGIARSRIIMDTASMNTYENLRCAARIIRDKELPREIAIATSDFHEYRASLMAGMFGLNSSAISVSTERYLYPTYFVRETIAIITAPLRIRSNNKKRAKKTTRTTMHRRKGAISGPRPGAH